MAVGITEHWELSMQLFDAVVESPVRKWDAELLRNPGQTSSKRDEVLQWAYQSPEIRLALAGDLVLYDIALDIFKGQTNRVLGSVWS